MFRKFFVFIVLFYHLSAEEYYIDSLHSSVGFSIKYLSVSESIGVFEDFSGKLFFEDNKIIKLSGSVSIDSINTFNKVRDKDLQSSKYFTKNEARLESIEFKDSKLATKLDINGVSRDVIFDVNINGPIINPSNSMKMLSNDSLGDINIVSSFNDDVCGCYISYGDSVLGIELTGVINRFDFNIANNTPSSLLGKYVTIKIIIMASR